MYQVDLADYWRGGLSLRRLSVLIEHLPPGSAVWAKRQRIDAGWSFAELLIADLYHAFTGEAHPSRPQPEDTAKTGRYASLRSRLEAQRKRHGT